MLARPYMPSTPSAFSFARACHVELTPPRKGPKHAQIRPWRQQHRSTDFAPGALLPYARIHNPSQSIYLDTSERYVDGLVLCVRQ